MKFIAVVLLFVVAGCSTTIDSYREQKPELSLESFFDGDFIAVGVVQDYRQKLTRHFCVELSASWQEVEGVNTAILDETFYFNDGEQQKRIWTLERIDSNSKNKLYQGTASDVVGVAQGRAVGNAFHWQYQLDIETKNKKGERKNIVLAVDDWIYQLSDVSAFNRSDLTKFGLKVGEISIFFDKTRKSCSSMGMA